MEGPDISAGPDVDEPVLDDQLQRTGDLEESRVNSALAGSRLFEHAKMLQAKKELLSRLLPEQCTFAPQINKRPSSAAAGSLRRGSAGSGLDAEAAAAAAAGGSTESPGDRLHQLARERQARLEARASAVGAEFTFSPTITKKAMALKAREGGASAGRSPGEALYQKAMERKAALEEFRARASLEGCTFSPAITAKAVRLKRASPAVERLYNPDWVARRRDPANNDPYGHIPEGATFQPAVNPPSASGSRSARSAASPRSSSLQPEEANGSSGSDTNANGEAQGSISETAAAGAGSSEARPATAPGAAFDRLYKGAAERASALEARRLALEAAQRAACPFQPDTGASKVSGARVGVREELLSSSTAAGAHSPRRASRVGEGEDEAAGASGGSVNGGAAAGGSSAFQRLYGDAQDRKARAAALADQEPPMDPDCTFEPALSVTTRRITERLRGGAGSPGSSAAALLGAEGALLLMGSSAASNASGGMGLLPRHLQLYAEGLKKQRERAALGELDTPLRPEDVRECTFQPNLIATTAQQQQGGSPSGGSVRAGSPSGAGSRLAASGGYVSSPAGSVARALAEAAPGALPVHERLYEEALAKRAAVAAALAGEVLPIAPPSPAGQTLSLAAARAASPRGVGGLAAASAAGASSGDVMLI